MKWYFQWNRILLTVWIPFGRIRLVSAAHDQLHIQEVNLLVTTDVHAWVAGRGRHESPTYNANYGHVVSFVERLRSKHPHKDIWFLMNGDFMDGTGLSSVPPTTLLPILKHMPWDALNIGNHELYHNETIEYMKESGFIHHWNGTYLTSNVRLAKNGNHVGSRYTLLKGRRATLLTFGFLYDMWNACQLTTVDKVEKVTRSGWFVEALTNLEYDAIVVLAHMDVEDPLVAVLLNSIRDVVGEDMVVQFITGHTHIRGNVALDDKASSFEAGHYLDTLGFVSFDTTDGSFHHRFIDANTKTLPKLLGADVEDGDPESWMTPNGTALSNLIHNTQNDLGLLEYVGCAKRTYYLEHALYKGDSLWGLYLRDVIRNYYLRNDTKSVYLHGVGAFRNDLWKGDIVKDDLISVSPFNDTIYKMKRKISGNLLLQYLLGGAPNLVTPGASYLTALPRMACSLDVIDDNEMYDLYAAEFDVPDIIERLENVTGETWYGEPQFKNGSGTIRVTSTGLWLDFVAEMWPTCPATTDAALPDWEFALVVFGVAVSILLFTCRLGSKYQKRAGYPTPDVGADGREVDMRRSAVGGGDEGEQWE